MTMYELSDAEVNLILDGLGSGDVGEEHDDDVVEALTEKLSRGDESERLGDSLLARFYEAGWRIADDGDPYRPEEVPAL